MENTMTKTEFRKRFLAIGSLSEHLEQDLHIAFIGDELIDHLTEYEEMRRTYSDWGEEELNGIRDDREKLQKTIDHAKERLYRRLESLIF